jgi:hypothetical protein
MKIKPKHDNRNFYYFYFSKSEENSIYNIFFNEIRKNGGHFYGSNRVFDKVKTKIKTLIENALEEYNSKQSVFNKLYEWNIYNKQELEEVYYWLFAGGLGHYDWIHGGSMLMEIADFIGSENADNKAVIKKFFN